LTAAMKKANTADGKKIAEVMRGLKIDSPFGADGTLTMRADDHTVVNYAIGYGSLTNKEPFMTNQVNGSWKQIYELESEWKKRKGWA
jgi:branched-chain amino acid transport system substrate-binding protein